MLGFQKLHKILNILIINLWIIFKLSITSASALVKIDEKTEVHLFVSKIPKMI